MASEGSRAHRVRRPEADCVTARLKRRAANENATANLVSCSREVIGILALLLPQRWDNGGRSGGALQLHQLRAITELE
jgi:hypothetical protein